jgi:hypothetical protein
MLKLNSLSGFGSGVSAGAGAAGRGFHLGGHTGSAPYQTAVDEFTYATGTMAVNTDAELVAGGVKLYTAWASDTALAGYSAGGSVPPNTDILTKLTYATDTHSILTDTMIDAHSDLGATTNPESDGYFFCGQGRSVTEKLSYSTENFSTLTDDFDFGRDEVTGMSAGATHGYVIAGYNQSTSEKITYSTDSTGIVTDAELPHVMSTHRTGINDATHGYASGGNTGANFSDSTYKMTFATDTMVAATDANLVVGRAAMGGAFGDGSVAGYWCGGVTAAATYVDTLEKLTFADSTTAAYTDATLSAAKAYGGQAGISELNY